MNNKYPEVENFVLMVMLQVQRVDVKRIREVIVTLKPHNAEQQTVAQLANKTIVSVNFNGVYT